MSLKAASMTDALHIVTHSQTFHADEVCAVSLLSLLFPRSTIDLTRTRDAETIGNAKTGTFVLDVGGVYDPETLRFDHHQSSFNDKYAEEFFFPMSSCGLIWKHYGENILSEVYKAQGNTEGLAYTAYKYFFAGIDANDNGVAFLADPNKTETNYKQPLSLSFCLSQLNLSGESRRTVAQDVAFMRATAVATDVIDGYLRTLVDRENAYEADLDMLDDAFGEVYYGNDDPSIMIIPRASDNVRRYLRTFDAGQIIKFIIAPRGDTEWQIWTVNYHHKPFDTYVKIQREEDMPEGSVKFVHKNRFIAVTHSQQAAVELAQRSMQNYRTWGNVPSRIYRWVFG
jgi:uncharacterized UPF0160 family protein